MGRGATKEQIDRYQFKTFDCPRNECPDKDLHRYYGRHFERFEDRLVTPIWSPRGHFLGFDSQELWAKNNDRFLLPESRWVSIWGGMPFGMEKVWRGASVVLVEGRYDHLPLEQIVNHEIVVMTVFSSHLSWNQMFFLSRWVRPPAVVWFAFDMDAAGQQGAMKSNTALAKMGITTGILKYGRSDEDIGDLWDRGGLELLRKEFSVLL